MKRKTSPLVLVLFVGLNAIAPAAVTLFAEYHLGEAGSLSGVNNLPQDSSGNGLNLNTSVSGSTATVGTTGVTAPGSTAYLDTSSVTAEGWYGASLAALPTDNFAVGVYASAASLAAANLGNVITLGNNAGSYAISLGSNGWAASAASVGWISATNGVTGSFNADQWVHLALIRSAGTTTFYIDGVANGSSTVAPVNSMLHLSVNPGGTAYFDGKIDEARILTFTAGETTSNILNNLQGVPEPSSALLCGVGTLALLRRRRRH